MREYKIKKTLKENKGICDYCFYKVRDLSYCNLDVCRISIKEYFDKLNKDLEVNNG